MTARVEVPSGRIVAFCERCSITKPALFGSVLREELGPDSDVALVEWRGVERSPNYLRQRAILQSAEVVYGS